MTNNGNGHRTFRYELDTLLEKTGRELWLAKQEWEDMDIWVFCKASRISLFVIYINPTASIYSPYNAKSNV